MPSPSRKASSQPAASQPEAKPALARSDDKHLVKIRLTAEQHKILRLAAAIREHREAPDRNA